MVYNLQIEYDEIWETSNCTHKTHKNKHNTDHLLVQVLLSLHKTFHKSLK